MSMLSLTLCFCLAGCHLSLAGWCVFLAGWSSSWLAGGSSWLAGQSSKLAGVSSWQGRDFFLVGGCLFFGGESLVLSSGFACWSFLLAGGGFFLAGWSPSRLSGALPGWIEC